MANPVQLRDLPRPDRLELEINPVHPLLVTDDGSKFTLQFAEALQNVGWPLQLVQTPYLSEDPRELPTDLSRLRIDSEDTDDMQQQLSREAERVGDFAGIIHLHPLAFSQARDRGIVKMTFFLAKFLAQHFKETENQPPGRKFFLTITQLDGRLGTSAAGSFQEGGGLSGLVKTFYREVPDVFCRYIDLDPSMKAEEKAAFVIRELHDPRHDLLEVGLSRQSRVTLTLGKG